MLRSRTGSKSSPQKFGLNFLQFHIFYTYFRILRFSSNFLYYFGLGKFRQIFYTILDLENFVKFSIALSKFCILRTISRSQNRGPKWWIILLAAECITFVIERRFCSYENTSQYTKKICCLVKFSKSEKIKIFWDLQIVQSIRYPENFSSSKFCGGFFEPVLKRYVTVENQGKKSPC